MAAQGITTILIKTIALSALLNVCVLRINNLNNPAKMTKKRRDFSGEVKQYFIGTLKVFHTQRDRAIIERARRHLVRDKTHVSGCPKGFVQPLQLGFTVAMNVEAMAFTVEFFYQASSECGASVVAGLIEDIEVNLSQLTPAAFVAG